MLMVVSLVLEVLLCQGDEVTFDYNYVRVFGAAAKKCVCGSSHCRGYIGGDPRNSEVIVQGDSDDEFPEPVMVYDDGGVDDSLKKLISSTSSLDDADTPIANAKQVPTFAEELDRAETVVKHSEDMKELRLGGDLLANVDSRINESADDVRRLEEICRNSGSEKQQISFEVMEKSAEVLQPSIQKLKPPSQLDFGYVATVSDIRQVIISSPEASALNVVKIKSVSNSSNTKKKHKSDKIGDISAPKSRALMKASRLSASVRKGKSSSNSGSLNKPEKMVNKSLDKPKKIVEGSSTGIPINLFFPSLFLIYKYCHIGAMTLLFFSLL